MINSVRPVAPHVNVGVYDSPQAPYLDEGRLQQGRNPLAQAEAAAAGDSAATHHVQAVVLSVGYAQLRRALGGWAATDSGFVRQDRLDVASLQQRVRAPAAARRVSLVLVDADGRVTISRDPGGAGLGLCVPGRAAWAAGLAGGSGGVRHPNGCGARGTRRLIDAKPAAGGPAPTPGMDRPPWGVDWCEWGCYRRDAARAASGPVVAASWSLACVSSSAFWSASMALSLIWYSSAPMSS